MRQKITKLQTKVIKSQSTPVLRTLHGEHTNKTTLTLSHNTRDGFFNFSSGKEIFGGFTNINVLGAKFTFLAVDLLRNNIQFTQSESKS